MNNRHSALVNDDDVCFARSYARCTACHNGIDEDAVADRVKAKIEPELVRYMDQIETAVSDNVTYEVSYCPAS